MFLVGLRERGKRLQGERDYGRDLVFRGLEVMPLGLTVVYANMER